MVTYEVKSSSFLFIISYLLSFSKSIKALRGGQGFPSILFVFLFLFFFSFKTNLEFLNLGLFFILVDFLTFLYDLSTICYLLFSPYSGDYFLSSCGKTCKWEARLTKLWDICWTDVGSIETVTYFYLFGFFLIFEAVSRI